MADFAAHYLFGQMLTGSEAQLPAAVNAHKSCYNWGLIGPDILLAHRFLTGGSVLRTLGGKMHSEKTARLFSAMAEYICALRGSERDCAEAYLYGFICHYCLDAEIHPYVYAQQARRAASDSSRSGNVHHFMIERDIDTDFYTWQRGAPVSEFRPRRLFATDELERLAIVRLYAYLLRCVYGAEISEREISAAISDALMLHIPQYAPAKLVAPAARLLDKITRKPDALASFIKDKKPDWDSLNLAHSQWRAPDGKLHSTSVPDMTTAALQKAQELIGEYREMLRTGRAKPVVYNINFDGEAC